MMCVLRVGLASCTSSAIFPEEAKRRAEKGRWDRERRAEKHVRWSPVSVGRFAVAIRERRVTCSYDEMRIPTPTVWEKACMRYRMSTSTDS